MVASHKRHDVTVVQHGGRMMYNVVISLKIKKWYSKPYYKEASHSYRFFWCFCRIFIYKKNNESNGSMTFIPEKYITCRAMAHDDIVGSFLLLKIEIWSFSKPKLQKLYSYVNRNIVLLCCAHFHCCMMTASGGVKAFASTFVAHDDVIKWKHFPRYWPFPPHKGQWCGPLMFSWICVWINGWVNNGETGDLRRYRAHYDATVMQNRVPYTCTGAEIQRLIIENSSLSTWHNVYIYIWSLNKLLS